MTDRDKVRFYPDPSKPEHQWKYNDAGLEAYSIIKSEIMPKMIKDLQSR